MKFEYTNLIKILLVSRFAISNVLYQKPSIIINFSFLDLFQQFAEDEMIGKDLTKLFLYIWARTLLCNKPFFF